MMNKKELQKKKLQKLQEMKKLFAARNRKLREKAETRPGAGLAKLLEGELERAELTLNAQDVVNKLQDTAEDLAKMSVEQLMPLVDEMKGEFGPDAAHRFDRIVGGALDSALQAVRDAREQVNNAVLKMQGKLSDEDVTLSDNDMDDDLGGGVGLDGPNDMEVDDLDADPDANVEVDDEFGGAVSASGKNGEPLGRARKESINLSKKKSKNLTEFVLLNHEETLAEAYADLAQLEDFDSLKLEVVADKYGICEEELFAVYNEASALFDESRKYRANKTAAIREALNIQEKEHLDEFLPMLGAVAGAGVRTLGRTALKKLGGMAAKKVGGMAMDKVDSMVPGNDEENGTQAPLTPAEQAKQEQEIKRNQRNNPKLRKLAAQFGVQPQDMAELEAVIASEGRVVTKPALKEHRILDEIASLEQADAVRIVKERIKAVQTGKDLAVRETFPADIKLSTPRMVVKQLGSKYGDPSGWAVARTNEGSHYVLSAPIPETEKAKSLEGEISSLEEEISSIRTKHSDVDGEYNLPQEIKVGDLRKRLGEYQTGYRHQVAKWLTYEEASALVSLAQSYAPKK